MTLKDRRETLCLIESICQLIASVTFYIPSMSEHQNNLRNDRLQSIKARTERFRTVLSHMQLESIRSLILNILFVTLAS